MGGCGCGCVRARGCLIRAVFVEALTKMCI